MVEPGDRLEQWEIVAPLGEGGMGSVFRCRHALSPDIEAAVKVLKPQLAGAEGRERFLREIRALHALRHPAIVRVMGFGEDSARGLLWMAMELVSGEDLYHHTQHGAMSPEVARLLFAKLADGLEHAHARGIFHRDIKPANVVFDASSGEGMLVDFGIAIDDGDTRLTGTGLIAGTPTYMAPELFASEPVDPRALDIYALGQCLCESLSGREAFADDGVGSGQQRLMRLMSTKLTMPCLDPGEGIPEPLRAIVRDATMNEPDDRIPSARILADRLRAASRPTSKSPEPIAVKEPVPVVAPVPAPSSGGTSWMLGLGIGGAATALLGGGAVIALAAIIVLAAVFYIPGTPGGPVTASIPATVLGSCQVSGDQLVSRNCTGCPNAIFTDGTIIDQILIAYFAMCPEAPNLFDIESVGLTEDAMPMIQELREMAARAPNDPTILQARQMYDGILQGASVTMESQSYSITSFGNINHINFSVVSNDANSATIQTYLVTGEPWPSHMVFTRQATGALLIQDTAYPGFVLNCIP